MAIALSVAYTATPLGLLTKMAVYATPQLSAGVNRPAQRSYKLIQVSAAAAASPLDILASYTAIYGALLSGKKIFFRLIVISSTGVPSAPFETSVTIT